MVWQAALGSLIGQASDDTKWIAGRLLDKGVGASQKFGQEHNVHMFNLARDEYHKRFQTATADAKKAGLHPLFALGGGVGGVPQAGSASIGDDRKAPMPATRSNLIRRVSAEETKSQQLDNRLKEQQIQSNDIELMNRASVEARKLQELQNSPTMAKAFSQAAVDAEALAELNRDFRLRSSVTTPTNPRLVIKGAYGGKYTVPGGVSPQEAVEPILGEMSDIPIGVGIGSRMLSGLSDQERRLRRMANQIAAARRAQKRAKRARYKRGRRLR